VVHESRTDLKLALRLMAAFLPVFLMWAQPAQAGGDFAEDPYEIAEKLFARGNYGTASKYYQKALKRDEVRAHYRLGLICEDAGKYGDALYHYQRFIDLGQPDDTLHKDAVRRAAAIEARLETKATRAAELLKRGKGLLKKGRYREAEQVLLRAVSEDTANPETHFSLGEVYMRLEEYRKARAEYEKAKRSY
jgi:tetratricopeptide (TPR) repeat protein